MENSFLNFIDEVDNYLATYGDNDESWRKLKILLAYEKPPSRLKLAYQNAKKRKVQLDRYEKIRELSKKLTEDKVAIELGVSIQNLRQIADRNGIKLKKQIDKSDEFAIDKLYSTRTESYGHESMLHKVTDDVIRIIFSRWNSLT